MKKVGLSATKFVVSKSLPLGLLAVLTLVPVAHTSVPPVLNLQGILRDSLGMPVTDGSYLVTLKIYDAPTGGNQLWTESQFVTTLNGLFSILLGAVNSIPDSAFADTGRYLCIIVNSDPELQPRKPLASVGYGFRVNSVDGALGGNIISKLSIGPGHSNTGLNAFVAGQGNTAGGDFASIGGGTQNRAGDFAAAVSGGQENAASGFRSFVGGGFADTASGSQAVVGGGQINVASGNFGTIAGGCGNRATDNFATAVGGFNNTVSNQYAFIGGGQENAASGSRSFVGGGFADTASGSQAVIGGGQINVASGTFGTIAGGCGNRASHNFTTAAGGFNNAASGEFATVAGGSSDTASGLYASIPGGLLNRASGNYALAAGRKAKADHSGSFVWADSTNANFASTGANQFLIRASGGVGVGTNNPQGALDVSSTTGAFIVPRMSTVQRDALAAVNGMIIYNTTNNQFNFYENGTWVTK